MTSPLKFIKSAVLSKDWPESTQPEIAVAGRSNAGKSSFLNALSGSKIAKVSNTPGKTRLLNFFQWGGKYRLVDMPGYGYAARSGGEVEDWQEMIETYLRGRETLCGLILVMDSRRKWAEEEEMLVQFCQTVGIPVAVVLTKIDKLSKNEIANSIKYIKQGSKLAAVFATSALKKIGQKEVEDYIFQEWIKDATKDGR